MKWNLSISLSNELTFDILKGYKGPAVCMVMIEFYPWSNLTGLDFI